VFIYCFYIYEVFWFKMVVFAWRAVWGLRFGAGFLFEGGDL